MGIHHDIRFLTICCRALLPGGVIKNFCTIYILGGNIIIAPNIVRYYIVRFAIGCIIMTYLDKFFESRVKNFLIICRMIIPTIRVLIFLIRIINQYMYIIKKIFNILINILLAIIIYFTIIFIFYHSRYFIEKVKIEFENEYNLYSGVISIIFDYKFNSLKGIILDIINYIYKYINGQIYYVVNYLHGLYKEPVYSNYLK